MLEERTGTRVHGENTLTVKFDFGGNTLYQLGYLAVDINQLLILCDLIEGGEHAQIRRCFGFGERHGKSSAPRSTYVMTRNSDIMRYGDRYRIESINDGCIEMVLLGIGSVAAVVMPLIAHHLNARKEVKDEEIVFHIDSDRFEQVSRLIDLEQFTHGFDGENINYLFEALRRNNYHVEPHGDNAYLISAAFNRYCDRAVKLVKRNK